MKALIVDDDPKYRAFVATGRAESGLVCSIAGVAPPRLRIPGWVGHGIAWGMETWASRTGTEPAATVRGIKYLQRNAFFDTTKARRELGLPSTPLETSIERAVTWFRDEKMV